MIMNLISKNIAELDLMYMDQFGLKIDKDETDINYSRKWSNKLKFDLFILKNLFSFIFINS